MSTKRSLGFSLVEILIALLISMLLMAGVLTILSSSKRTYALQDELAKLQENARFVMDKITFDLRMAGYSGCANAGVGNSPFNGSRTDVSIRTAKENAQEEYELTSTVASFSPPMRSDALRITYFADQLKLDLDRDGISHKDNPMPAGERLLGAEGDSFFLHKTENKIPAVNDLIKISDCGYADNYVVTNVNTSNPNNPIIRIRHQATGRTRFGRDYRAPIEVFSTATSINYEVGAIDKNGNNNVTDDVDGFALFKDGSFFIEGVQALNILYGLDKDGDNVANVYTTNPGGGGNVVSVRMSVLMRTANYRRDIGEGNKEVADSVWDKQFEPAAGYRYRSFTSTIRVRNIPQ